jgi:hypothetical protein
VKHVKVLESVLRQCNCNLISFVLNICVQLVF